VFTALATLPLLFLGAEVTTKRVGMADPVWPTHPLYLLLEGSGLEKGLGFLIEHSHRLAGWTVGLCSIFLVVAAWLWESRPWVRGLAIAVLVGVTIQGLLGGFRVRLHAVLGTDLALIHGCFGQMVFAAVVSLAICTSRRWREAQPVAVESEDATNLRRWSLLVVALLITQLILGAFVRHRLDPLAQRGHLLIAFAVVAAVLGLAWTIWAEHAADRNLVRASRLLLVLLGVQLLLGVEAWMTRAPQLLAGSEVVAAEPAVTLLSRDVVRSLHVLVGSCLLATAVAGALEAHRAVVLNTVPTPAPAEEVA
jgi:heme A synthase